METVFMLQLFSSQFYSLLEADLDKTFPVDKLQLEKKLGQKYTEHILTS